MYFQDREEVKSQIKIESKKKYKQTGTDINRFCTFASFRKEWVFIYLFFFLWIESVLSNVDLVNER